VISNLIGGQLVRWQGPKRILSLAMMACIVLSLCGFLEKPSYAGLIALWTLFSFGFGTSMIILFPQAGTLQNQQEKGWMSFYQGISGVGVILGMGFGWLTNSHHFPLDLHFPLVGFGLALCMVFLIRVFEPLHQDQSEESAPWRITFTLVLLTFSCSSP
jgi:predicted MFS family arabinose efflux permease